MAEFDPSRLAADVAAKPELLRHLAATIDDDPWTMIPGDAGTVALYGMGSSYFAAAAAARRMRAAGRVVLADRASVAVPLVQVGDAAVANVVVSNGGSSPEALAVADALGPEVIALTNQSESPLAQRAAAVVELDAGIEVSGVSAKSYAATIVRLLQLERRLGGGPADLAARVATAADAVDELLATSSRWLEALADDALGPHGTWLLAPAERSGSAQQGALMLREAPRLPADACETGDWSHVDVYLTKTLDYRAIVFAGSAWDEAAAAWMRRRGTRWWTIGASISGERGNVLYAGCDDPVVALLAEVTVAELLATARPVG